MWLLLKVFVITAVACCFSCMAADCDSEPSLCMAPPDETSLLQVTRKVELATARAEKLGGEGAGEGEGEGEDEGNGEEEGEAATAAAPSPSAAEKTEEGAESKLDADEVSPEKEETTVMLAEKARNQHYEYPGAVKKWVNPSAVPGSWFVPQEGGIKYSGLRGDGLRDEPWEYGFRTPSGDEYWFRYSDLLERSERVSHAQKPNPHRSLWVTYQGKDNYGLDAMGRHPEWDIGDARDVLEDYPGKNRLDITSWSLFGDGGNDAKQRNAYFKKHIKFGELDLSAKAKEKMPAASDGGSKSYESAWLYLSVVLNEGGYNAVLTKARDAPCLERDAVVDLQHSGAVMSHQIATMDIINYDKPEYLMCSCDDMIMDIKKVTEDNLYCEPGAGGVIKYWTSAHLSMFPRSF